MKSLSRIAVLCRIALSVLLIPVGARAADAVLSDSVEFPQYGVSVHHLTVASDRTPYETDYLDRKYLIELMDRLWKEEGAVRNLVRSVYEGHGCTQIRGESGDDDGQDSDCWGDLSYEGILNREYASGGSERDRYILNWRDDGTAQVTTPGVEFDFDMRAEVVSRNDGNYGVTVTTIIAGMAAANKNRLPAVPGAPVRPECLMCP